VGNTRPPKPAWRLPSISEICGLIRRKCLELVAPGTEWGHPVVWVAKDTVPLTLRACVACTDLNAAMKDTKPWAPLDMKSVVESARGYKYFSTFDFADAFWQIELPVHLRPLFAIRTGITENVPGFGDISHLQPTRLPHGFKRASEMFAAATSASFADMIADGSLAKFVDDCSVRSRTEEEHVRDVIRFLERCIRDGWKLKMKKMRLGQAEASQLGVIFDGKTRRIDPERLQGMRDFSLPKGKKQLEQYLVSCPCACPMTVAWAAWRCLLPAADPSPAGVSLRPLALLP
jgi:hypothetical protein